MAETSGHDKFWISTGESLTCPARAAISASWISTYRISWTSGRISRASRRCLLQYHLQPRHERRHPATVGRAIGQVQITEADPAQGCIKLAETARDTPGGQPTGRRRVSSFA